MLARLMMQLMELSRGQWEEAWAALPAGRREVYFHPGYAAVCERWERARAGCLKIGGAERWMLYPYLAHPIDGVCDIQTPYGYGGPIFVGEWSDLERVDALRAAGDFFAGLGAVAEFVRCHSHWSDPDLLSKAGFRTFQVRTNVECDLAAADFTESWSSGARRNLRKARGCGLGFRMGEGEADVETFARLYGQTAKRLAMSPGYCFDDGYFRALVAIEGVRLVIVEWERIAIAAAIVFIGGELAHYHLGASDFAHQERRPNDFLYYAMAQAAREAGCRRIIWGGGMSNDPADSLFRFKTHFGAIRTPVFCAGRVLDGAGYEALCAAWQQRHPEAASRLFLKYRG